MINFANADSPCLKALPKLRSVASCNRYDQGTLRSVYLSNTLCSLNRHSRPVEVSVYVDLERRPRPQATATKQLSCRSPNTAERPFNGSDEPDWGRGRIKNGKQYKNAILNSLMHALDSPSYHKVHITAFNHPSSS